MKVALQVRMDKELRDASKKRAQAQGISVSEFVRQLLEKADHFESHPKPDRCAPVQEIGLMPWEQTGGQP